MPLCGQIRARVVCPEHLSHHLTKIPNTCYKPECPECWPKWAARAARNADSHLKGYEEAYKEQYSARHVTLSPPAHLVPMGADPAEILRWLYASAAAMLPSLNIRAALVVPHPYRLVDEHRADAEDVASKDHKHNRYRVALEMPNWQDWLKFSPHVHLICYGFLPPADQFTKDSGGWVYRVHKNRAMHEKNYGKVVNYLLTHAWTVGNHKVVRAYGNLAPRRLAVTTKRTREPRPCPVCGTNMVRLQESERVYEKGCPRGWVYQDLHHAPQAFLTKVTKTYSIRAPSRTVRCPRSGGESERGQQRAGRGPSGPAPPCAGGVG